MRMNLPVSSREIDYEESRVFITKTDADGNITYTNDAFVEISGFSREELIGSPHSIVRHPDMPEWVFKSMWETLKGGYPWRGIVKNRAKNGDHYWVRATVSPIIDHDKAIGFISLRKKPTPDEVAAAEAVYRSGRVSSGRLSLAQRFRNLTLQHKLQLLIQPILLLMLMLGSISIVRDSHISIRETAKQRADAVANEVVDTANMMMVSGQISDSGARRLMVKKLSDSGNIIGLRLMRTDQQFGPGLAEEQIQDDVQRGVAASKKPYYSLEEQDGKPVFRAVTPYLASRNFHGTDCLTCHNAEEGSVIGVSDVQIDLSPEFAKFRNTILEQIALQVVFQILLFFLIRWIIVRFVTKPVEEIRMQLNEVINGHMSGQMNISGRDEMGDILCLVQSTKVLLGSVIDQIASASGHIDARSQQLSDTMVRVAEGSQAQADAASTMAAAVEEMTVSIDQIADNAEEVHKISESSAQLAADGGKIVQQVVDGMVKTNEAVMHTAQTVQKLGEQSEHIHSVVKVIKEIADQTNLLALNAAIEAARAGEQGRGFAVVADEVRKLAEKTGGSTEEIAGVIEAIRASTANAIAEMERTVEMVKAGAELAERAGASIVEINGGVARARTGVEDISGAIKEQSQASREIAVNVEKVAQMSEENSSAVRNVSATVTNLKELSVSLEQSVGHFRI